MCSNLVPRVSHYTAPSIAPGGGKMRDPGNEVECVDSTHLSFFPANLNLPGNVLLSGEN